MQVKMYFANNCPICRLAFGYFEEKGIRIQSIRINKSNMGILEKESNQLGVPVIKIDNRIVIGYDRNTLNEIFGFEEEEE